MKKAVLLIIVLCMSIMSVYAEEKNLFVDSEDTFDGLMYSYSNGVLTNDVLGTGSVFISVPGLTKNYTFKGHVKIVEIGIQPWNGIRLIIGLDSFSSTSKLVITRDWGTRVEFKMNNMNDLMGYSDSLPEGTEFDFEVIRTGQHYVFKFNGEVCLEGDLPEDLDAFDEENDLNLGFEASECLYEVSNIEIYCPEAAARTPSPEPTPTATPTATEAAAATPTSARTSNNTSDTEDGENTVSPVVIGICVVAVIAVAGVIFAIVKDKKKNKRG